jgi:glucose-6-phosphate isomerase
VLDIQKKVVDTLKQTDSPLSLDELATKAQIKDEVETVYKIVRHLNANKRGIIVHGNIGQPKTIRVAWQK